MSKVLVPHEYISTKIRRKMIEKMKLFFLFLLERVHYDYDYVHDHGTASRESNGWTRLPRDPFATHYAQCNFLEIFNGPLGMHSQAFSGIGERIRATERKWLHDTLKFLRFQLEKRDESVNLLQITRLCEMWLNQLGRGCNERLLTHVLLSITDY